MTSVMRGMHWLGRTALDFALARRAAPDAARSPTCRTVLRACWQKVEWLGQGGCHTCGLPLEATEIDACARCMAQPPIIARTRAAVAYGEIARTLVLRLKYSRKVALAQTMARYMRPLGRAPSRERSSSPVPLHWSRLWWRGFNQSGLLAANLARLTGLEHRPEILGRTKRTRPLKNMSPKQRASEVRAAFAVERRGSASKGRQLRAGRRRADHRQHVRRLRQGVAPRRRRAGRADLFRARGAAGAARALRRESNRRSHCWRRLKSTPNRPVLIAFAPSGCWPMRQVAFDRAFGRLGRRQEGRDDRARRRAARPSRRSSSTASISAAATICSSCEMSGKLAELLAA